MGLFVAVLSLTLLRVYKAKLHLRDRLQYELHDMRSLVGPDRRDGEEGGDIGGDGSSTGLRDRRTKSIFVHDDMTPMIDKTFGKHDVDEEVDPDKEYQPLDTV